MSKLKDRSSVHLSVQQQVEFEQGLVQLKARCNKMRASMMLSLMLGIMAVVALYFNQQLIYAFFEISPTLQQLHVPFSAQAVQDRIGGQNFDLWHNKRDLAQDNNLIQNMPLIIQSSTHRRPRRSDLENKDDVYPWQDWYV